MRTLRVALVALVATTACASVPLKVQATRSLQASETALAAAQDLERALCFNSPTTERGSHCTNPAALSVKLTDEVHVKFAQGFSNAFKVQDKAALEVEHWQMGQPQPPSFALYYADAKELLGLAQALATVDSRTAQLLAHAQAAVDAAGAVAAALGVK